VLPLQSSFRGHPECRACRRCAGNPDRELDSTRPHASPRTDLQENCMEFLAKRRLLSLLNKNGDHISNKFFDGAALVVCRLKALTTEGQLVLNANNAKDGLLGMSDQHGRRIVFVCGTLHHMNTIVGRVNSADHTDGKRWSCRECGWRQAVWNGSFFAGSHLSLFQIMLCMYMWAHDESQDRIMHELGISRNECENCVENE